MKTLFLDLSMGAAGDMLSSALLELLPDSDAFIDEFNQIGIPGVSVKRLDAEKCGIRGSRFVVEIHGEEEGDDHPEHHYHHRSMAEIEGIIKSLRISETAKENVFAVYSLLAEAEGRVHGKPVTEIHFHEVGMNDAIADITAFCVLLEKLKIEKIIASPVCVGRGRVKCAHGILPVPAPATAELLLGIPSYASDFDGELCTPTGAALLRHFVSSFEKMPPLAAEKIGYGIGKKDFPAANCLRAFLCESEATESVTELTASIDDMTGEEIGFALERFLDEGALDAYTSPLQMKKGRPGILLTVLCKKEEKERFIALIFRHTSTLGLRECEKRRRTLSRRVETIETPLGAVRIKKSGGFGVEKEKIEYEDIARIAKEKGINLSEVKKLIIDSSNQ